MILALLRPHFGVGNSPEEALLNLAHRMYPEQPSSPPLLVKLDPFDPDQIQITEYKS